MGKKLLLEDFCLKEKNLFNLKPLFQLSIQKYKICSASCRDDPRDERLDCQYCSHVSLLFQEKGFNNGWYSQCWYKKDEVKKMKNADKSVKDLFSMVQYGRIREKPIIKRAMESYDNSSLHVSELTVDKMLGEAYKIRNVMVYEEKDTGEEHRLVGVGTGFIMAKKKQ